MQNTASNQRLFAVGSEALQEAQTVYDRYQLSFGNNITLDQALRLTKHCVKTGFIDHQTVERARQSIRECEIVAFAARDVARRLNRKGSIDKAVIIDELVVYLKESMR